MTDEFKARRNRPRNPLRADCEQILKVAPIAPTDAELSEDAIP
jgi:hypothetical protein